MHEELWEQLTALDGRKTSQRAGCQYLPEHDRYVVTLLNKQYTVDLTERQIFPAGAGSQAMQAGFLEQLCILAYLINAKDLPLAGKLVKAESLPGGQFFFRGHHALPTEKLKEAFAEKPELLHEAAGQFGAGKCDFGNASVEVFVLPRVPLTFVIWAGDEEFAARASVLFDKTAGEHLLLDALLTAVELAVDGLVKAAKSISS